jgi:acyl-coenzyme A synthetase/AMP-(fatty) acid ligase
MFTSGTTGRPKSVSQSLANITKGVRVGSKFKDNIWGFAYNPTHFAGLQVFFQAFFNKNKIVYIFGKYFPEVVTIIAENSITTISSTPSFIKMLLPNIKEPIESLNRLTFGGEQFDNSVINKINIVFPNVILKNVYASTEAGSLLISEGDRFKIPSKFSKLLRIEEEELLIHSSLMGRSDSLELIGDWYYSGDLVDVIDDGSFKFRARKSEMINVGGYKVNPKEVEAVIKGIEGVLDAKVYGRKNSVLGYLVALDIIKEENIKKNEVKALITKECQNLLQDFKIPRIIKFVESFEMTRTGKIKR